MMLAIVDHRDRSRGQETRDRASTRDSEQELSHFDALAKYLASRLASLEQLLAFDDLVRAGIARINERRPTKKER